MPWLVPLCLWLGLVAIVAGVFMAAVKNARALRRDVETRFAAAEASLEQEANALVDELFARTKDRPE